jgi:hypothetical protein
MATFDVEDGWTALIVSEDRASIWNATSVRTIVGVLTIIFQKRKKEKRTRKMSNHSRGIILTRVQASPKPAFFNQMPVYAELKFQKVPN